MLVETVIPSFINQGRKWKGLNNFPEAPYVSRAYTVIWLSQNAVCSYSLMGSDRPHLVFSGSAPVKHIMSSVPSVHTPGQSSPQLTV